MGSLTSPVANQTLKIMRKRFPIMLAALSWPLLVCLVASWVQAPLAARPAQPVKPIKVWSAVASWYGPQFQGQTTASGQPFDMFAPTAAHAWLPFGSLIRVVNARTGRSQLVRINDRGPFQDDRELDVSFLVASRLGLIERGVNLVRIELLEVPQRP
jgi:rare lipoprotein A (peptidoglycan hydrolase)